MSIRDLVLVALFAAIIVALGIIPPIPLGFIPVPITAQTLGVMLAGCILGAKRGALAAALVLLLVAIGLPVLAGGRGGMGVLAGPTGGFIIGWVFGAYITGMLCEKLIKRGSSQISTIIIMLIAAVIGGIGVVYLFGIPWLAVVNSAPVMKVLIGSMAFVPGDLVKAVLATVISASVLKNYPLLPGFEKN